MTQNNKIFDNHVHTQYAYCSQNDLLPESTVKIAKEKGYGICIAEHAAQLYVQSEDFWSAKFINEPELIYDDATNRMDEYIGYISGFKADDVRIGLELDINRLGEIAIRDEHLDSFELFLGAVHYIPERFNDIDEGLLWNIDIYGNYKVDILAHPFRIYKRLKLPKPVHLYYKVAKMLAKYDIAVELNFHTNEPDREFFRMCIESGVKIALGSDAHRLDEVGSFERYFELLNDICKGNIEDILFSPKKVAK